MKEFWAKCWDSRIKKHKENKTFRLVIDCEDSQVMVVHALGLNNLCESEAS